MDKNASPRERVKVSLTDKLEIVSSTDSLALCAPLTADAGIGLAEEITRVASRLQPAAGTPQAAEVQSALSQAWGWLRVAQAALAQAHGTPPLERLN